VDSGLCPQTHAPRHLLHTRCGKKGLATRGQEVAWGEGGDSCGLQYGQVCAASHRLCWMWASSTVICTVTLSNVLKRTVCTRRGVLAEVLVNGGSICTAVGPQRHSMHVRDIETGC